ncbi:BZ3500_MvSof-1268-A1-R1_Chr2-2g04851 [Microbotryum saponariae]|uniref:BZ3500_MvSof-1268-A1-R1_Chr2-2g04851 protein n=1 Tax=Microbotryum saponariae TaxID=289078 RepID=A0A2X0LMR1_9BASI|nr:BZ3500_MvSof-1268-A1-R1_Chr2-2g04851 [Microbotryum saponariae]SDA00323.1 BZ3501_MvSof-1269-A2-R1_Chr2-2g04525 [Microbotryum saponariae]
MHLSHEQHVNIPSYPAFANRLQSSASTRRSALSDPPRLPLQADIINQTWLQQKDHGRSPSISDPCHPWQHYPSPESITSDLPPLLAPGSTSVFGAPPHVAASSRSVPSVVEQGPASGAGARDVKQSLSDGSTSPPPPPHKRTRTRSYSISSATSNPDTHRSVRSSSYGTSFSGTSAGTGLSTTKCRSSASSRAISKAYESRRYVAEALRAAIQSGRVNAATVSNDTVSRIVEGARKKAAKEGLAGKRAQGRSRARQESGQPDEQAELRVRNKVKQVVRNAVSVEEDGEIEVNWDELSTLGQDGRKRRRANKTTTVMAVPV